MHELLEMLIYIRFALKFSSGELSLKDSSFGSRSSVVREFSVQLCSVNQMKTEAEQVADSEIRTKSVTQKRRHS
jgi:hypothetical protein